MGAPIAAKLVGEAAAQVVLARILRASEQALIYNPVDGDISPQTVTVTDGTAQDASLTQRYSTVFNGALVDTVPWSWLGGKPYVSYSFLATAVSLSEAPGAGNLNGQASDNSLSYLMNEIEFLADAPVIEFALDTFHEGAAIGGAGWHLRVDGKPVSTKNATLFGGQSAPRFLKINFGSRAPRRLRWTSQAPLQRVAIGPSDFITKLEQGYGITGLVVGDSFERGGNLAAGSTSGVADLSRAWAWVVRDLLGWRDVRVAGIGGTGYLNAAGTQNTYRQRLTAGPGLVALHGQPEVIILKSSQNDWTQSQAMRDATPAEALATWRAYRAAYPKSLIVVTGLHSQNTGPNSTFINGENALRAQFEAWADPFSMFVPISTDTPPWLKGTGTVTAPNGSGSNDYYCGGDASHLAGVVGNEYSARRFTNGFRSQLRARASSVGVLP